MDREQILEDIQDGIRAELHDTPDTYLYTVRERQRDGALWTLVVEPAQGNKFGVDESLEEATAWWAEPFKGAADVLAVIPESQTIHLRHAINTPPGPGQTLFLYPPKFLESLLEAWQRPAWPDMAIERFGVLKEENDVAHGRPVAIPFTWLRKSQQDAFRLPCHKFGYLWGPPGTGKTTTLGALLAAYLLYKPESKILLLSTTNVAVDLAILSVDSALEKIAVRDKRATELRKKCFRVGNHFHAGKYQGREHLLPVKNTGLIAEMTRLEAAKPTKDNAQVYGQWVSAREALQARIRAESIRVLDTARLAALTTTRAVFTLDDLSMRSKYDLIVFDEASQVGQAHAIVLFPLGLRVIFAGDDKQLSPIVRSKSGKATEWLGKSAFAHMRVGHQSSVFLDEQSRMVQPISDIVSQVFYKGNLKLAGDARRDPQFLFDRRLRPIAPFGAGHVNLHTATSEGIYSQKYGGPIRFDTAKEIASWVSDMLSHLDPEDILVLTPFRAQRTIIRMALRNANVKGVTVSTVHKAQGSEQHTVIFDPVAGYMDFMKTDQAKQLINVAISRAKARLIFIASPNDRTNPIIDQIAKIIEFSGMPKSDSIPLETYIDAPTFPLCMVGKIIQFGEAIGTVSGDPYDVNRFCINDIKTGKVRSYVTANVIKIVRSKMIRI